MTVCVEQIRINVEGLRKPVDVSFDGPKLSSDGGFLLLSQVDRDLGLCERVADLLPDNRDPTKIRHPRVEQIQQRIFQIAQGYEDQNDADHLRHDPILQFACANDPSDEGALSSQPTLSRLENAISMRDNCLLLIDFEQAYVDSLESDAEVVVLDLDSTDHPTHGQQAFTFYHGYYRQYIYHPLLIFDGLTGQLVSAILRPGNAYANRGSGYVLERIIRKIREKCPCAQILVRGDSAFSAPRLHELLERLDDELSYMDFLFGQATNETLKKIAAPYVEEARKEFEDTGKKVRMFFEFEYAAGTWNKAQRVIGKVEYTSRGANTRFVVTSLVSQDAQTWYDGYCQRGQAENFIKEFKNAIAGGRLSCRTFQGNFFRLLLHGWAYRLMWELRKRVEEESPEVGSYQFDTLRLRLLKVGVWFKESARRVQLQLPCSFPLAGLFRQMLSRGQELLPGT